MSVLEITPDRAKALLSEGSGHVYLDVRSAAEFEAGRPAGAWNIPLAEPNPATGEWEFNRQFLSTVESRFTRDARLIVGCQSGGRSAQACEILQAAGFVSAVNMTGGFGGVPGPGGRMIEPGWVTLGYPIEQGDAGERSFASLSKPQ